MFKKIAFKKTSEKITALSAALGQICRQKHQAFVFWFAMISLAMIAFCAIIDQSVSFYVREKVFERLEDVPYRPYALVLGTSKYVAAGKTNAYYDNRLMAAKALLDQGKVSYLLLSGDNRTLQYNEPRAMYRDLRKMGVSEALMFRDFAGFRTLDSVVRANKVFQVTSFTIISQKFHCERALLIAKFHHIDAICFAAKQPQLDIPQRVRETFARIKAVFDLLFDIKPYFLGEPEPLPKP